MLSNILVVWFFYQNMQNWISFFFFLVKIIALKWQTPCLKLCTCIWSKHLLQPADSAELAINLIIWMFYFFNQNPQYWISFFYLVKIIAMKWHETVYFYLVKTFAPADSASKHLPADSESGSYQARSYYKKNCSSSFKLKPHKLQSCWSVVAKYLNWQTITNV